jgi:hypothetical protein
MSSGVAAGPSQDMVDEWSKVGSDLPIGNEIVSGVRVWLGWGPSEQRDHRGCNCSRPSSLSRTAPELAYDWNEPTR